MKWYLAVSIAEEVQMLRERATILHYGTLLVLLNEFCLCENLKVFRVKANLAIVNV